MVKLRGVNIWPEAIGLAATAVDGAESDYFVQARRIDGRDDMLGFGGPRPAATRHPHLVTQIEGALQARFGLKLTVEVVEPGSIDGLTEVGTAPKPKRFRDDRPVAAHDRQVERKGRNGLHRRAL